MGDAMTNKTVFKLPDYTRSLPDKALLSGKELADLLGLTGSGFRARVDTGKFPKHDFDSQRGSCLNKKYHWRLSTLRKYEAEQSAG
jgi:hypothetical protein